MYKPKNKRIITFGSHHGYKQSYFMKVLETELAALSPQHLSHRVKLLVSLFSPAVITAHITSHMSV